MGKWKLKQDRYFLEGTLPKGQVPFLEVFGPRTDNGFAVNLLTRYFQCKQHDQFLRKTTNQKLISTNVLDQQSAISVKTQSLLFNAKPHNPEG